MSVENIQHAGIRIGYWLAEKKVRKLVFEEFEDICRKAGDYISKIHLDKPLEQQGPFNVILHKLTDQVARALSGDAEAQKQINRFQDYVNQNPGIVVVDPLENVMKLFDRHHQYLLVKECTEIDESSYFAPSFVEFLTLNVEDHIRLIKENGLMFPIVCKPTASHGSSQCHQMSIVFHEVGLKCIEIPCVAQTFVNHNARLFKVFVIGDKQFIVERPSLKNFIAGEYDTIFFNSNDVSRPNASSYLTTMSEVDLELPVFMPNEQKLTRLGVKLQQTFGLDLFGFDVIIENTTGRYAIIDINTFPGYEDVPNFSQELYSFILHKANVPHKIFSD